jgi:DNA-binding winged helix-turn-helix (wHTH) protein/tetratricopeptide (TPR) repeat protein
MNAGTDSQVRLHGAEASVWSFGDAELDEHRHELRVGGHVVALEAKPYELLRVFVQRAGETLSKDELIESVWPGRVVTEGVLAKSVTKLRSALGDGSQSIIKNVHGFGYRLAMPVSARVSLGAAFAPRIGDAVERRPNWRFERELKGGGFGQVWLVEHMKTHERRVLKFAADGAQLHALKREITLYRLLHDTLGARAEVVRLIDWNVDEPPYFIEAEYVACGNLVEWCEQRGGAAEVPREWRIEIIARIADALAAAHTVGVLHKDMKPANVLIAPECDACPRIRLSDFGSGRALEPERLAELGISRLGMTQTQAGGDSTSGTPYYLAPELIAGRAATVRADIYALGVMLYQILIADFRSPLAPGWERDIDDELLREDIAAAADVDPERRLGDAGELARRLRSLPARAEQRAGERAAAESLRQHALQLSRWQTRRRWLVVLCVMFAIAAIAVASLYFRAQREAAIAQAVNNFLNEDLLAAADPYTAQRSDLRVRDVLDRARGAVGERFGNRPLEEAAIRTTLGRSYGGIGDYAEARRQFARALPLLSDSEGVRGEQTLALRRAIADNDVIDSHYEDAEHEYAALLADVSANGAESDAVLDVHVAQAHLELRRGHSEIAANAIESLLPRLRARGDATATLAALSDLGQACREMARFDQAEAAYREVYEARRAQLGDAHYATLQTLQDLAVLERARGHLDKAVELQKSVLAGREKLFGRAHEETQNAINELASMYQDQNRYADAEPLFREVLAAREHGLGERHERTRNSLNNLGLVLELEGKLDESEGYFRRVLAIERELLGADDLQVLILMHNLAGLEDERGRFVEAEALHREVVERATRTLASTRPEQGLFLVGLAQTLQKQKRYAESADTFAAARKNLLAAYGPTHARVIKLAQMEAKLYEEWGRPLPASTL